MRIEEISVILNRVPWNTTMFVRIINVYKVLCSDDYRKNLLISDLYEWMHNDIPKWKNGDLLRKLPYILLSGGMSI